ncbi:hypothetical protein SAMN05216188_119147 [Lentzea xinjiangensis]|uniref:Uncharacterized protein n=1 Tax=Lentzea xinjiangensis TaxID=402600 RepID=A0A1H9TYH7_9PSEU|nr:hypothetical protein SAMN05216188_119147 [Lentzea xinjiangensis]
MRRSPTSRRATPLRDVTRRRRRGHCQRREHRHQRRLTYGDLIVPPHELAPCSGECSERRSCPSRLRCGSSCSRRDREAFKVLFSLRENGIDASTCSVSSPSDLSSRWRQPAARTSCSANNRECSGRTGTCWWSAAIFGMTLQPVLARVDWMITGLDAVELLSARRPRWSLQVRYCEDTFVILRSPAGSSIIRLLRRTSRVNVYVVLLAGLLCHGPNVPPGSRPHRCHHLQMPWAKCRVQCRSFSPLLVMRLRPSGGAWHPNGGARGSAL